MNSTRLTLPHRANSIHIEAGANANSIQWTGNDEWYVKDKYPHIEREKEGESLTGSTPVCIYDLCTDDYLDIPMMTMPDASTEMRRGGGGSLGKPPRR